MTRINKANLSATQAQTKQPRASKKQMLKLLVKSAVSQHNVSVRKGLERDAHNPSLCKLSNGNAAGFIRLSNDDKDTAQAWGHDAFAVDLSSKEFYTYSEGIDTTVGPYKLPAEFDIRAFFSTKNTDPKPKNDVEKVIANLSKCIREQDYKLFGQPLQQLQRDANGQELSPSGHKAYFVECFEGQFEHGEGTFAFDMRSKEFWKQETYGFKGPYELPKNFMLDDLKTFKKNVEDMPRVTGKDEFYRDGFSSRPDPGTSSDWWPVGGDNSQNGTNAIKPQYKGSALAAYWSGRSSGGARSPH